MMAESQLCHREINVERIVEVFIAITSLVVGASHYFRPREWADAYRQLSRCGLPGAFFNGMLHLMPGAFLVAGHASWSWPGTLITGLGWLLVAKSAVCFLAPEWALISMERGGRSPRGFVFAGLMLLAIAGWACYCLWWRSQSS